MYGQSPLIGSTIDPRLFVYDYSVLNKANELKAQGLTNLGAGIGQAAAQIGDYFKQQKEKAKSVDTASRIAGLLEAKAPDLVPGIGQLKAVLDDQEIPLSQRISAAESLYGTMKVGFDVQNLINQNAIMDMRKQKFAASQAGGGEGGGDSSNINPFTGQPY